MYHELSPDNVVGKPAIHRSVPDSLTPSRFTLVTGSFGNVPHVPQLSGGTGVNRSDDVGLASFFAAFMPSLQALGTATCGTRTSSLADRPAGAESVTRTMPMGNKTRITDEERALLGRWIAQGAKGP